MERATAATRKPDQPKQPVPKPKRQGYAADGRILDKQWDGRDTFNVPEVAKILNLGTWAAWQAVWKGEIPSIKIGGRVIIPRQAIERLLSVS
jgi:Helix-turn-helix domain